MSGASAGQLQLLDGSSAVENYAPSVDYNVDLGILYFNYTPISSGSQILTFTLTDVGNSELGPITLDIQSGITDFKLRQRITHHHWVIGLE